MNWSKKRVLVTGGMGFVGSNLSHRLVEEGAEVTIIDNMLPDHGGNLFNLQGIAPVVQVNFADIRSKHAMNHLVQNQEYIIHLAGQVNHVASMVDPLSDLQINTQGTLTLVEACRTHNPDAKIVFSGTRGSYGKAAQVPVAEDHPSNPLGVYAVTNAAAEQFLRVYQETYGIKSVRLRITNTFGPRHQMKHNQYGVANWFMRQALDNLPITVMGDGSIQRDYLYIDDLVEAILVAATTDAAYGEVINIGRGAPTSFLELAEQVVSAVGKGSIKKVPFSAERLALEPGHYYADTSKAKRLLHWSATTSIEAGLIKTRDFYNEHKPVYWA